MKRLKFKIFSKRTPRNKVGKNLKKLLKNSVKEEALNIENMLTTFLKSFAKLFQK
jgi:hypothetical protein